MSAKTLKAKMKVCMFDQYGTVVDMQKGLTEVVTPYLKDKGWSGRPDAFVTWWRRTHFENSMIDALLHRAHTPYREIGHRAVAYTLERAGIQHTMDEVRFLVAQIERLKPFPEVPEALARLKTRYKIAVLSNGDPDMLESAKAFHEIPFDAVISVAVANAFKPHVATYTKAAEIMGVRMDEVLFVANTPGQRNGTAEMWLDGTKVMEYGGIMFVEGGESGRWDAVNWGPIWGGAGGTIIAPFYAQMDHMVVSGR